MERTSVALALANVLAVLQVVETTVVDQVRVVIFDLVDYLLLVRNLGVGVLIIIESKHTRRLLLDPIMNPTNENS